MSRGSVRVGISGWTYTPWRGVFYPPGLPASAELGFAARAMAGALEVNGTFYRLQRPAAYRRWAEAVPPGFVLALKGGRFVTHTRRLRDVEVPLANFLASGVLALGDRLGPVLWQLPPTLPLDPGALRAFLELLPRDTAAAAALAARHDARVPEPWLDPGPPRPLRHALEVRHPSFVDRALPELLRAHGVALVVAETAGRYPLLEDVTADFVYVRLHGAERLYASGYTPRQLDAWAARIEAWASGGEPADARRVGGAAEPRPREVYVFLDNTDVKLRAPFDARALARRLGLPLDAGVRVGRWPGRADDRRPPTRIRR